MKSTIIFAAFALVCSALVSCESTNSRRAGGAAFDDSQLGRTLDSSAHLPDPDNPSGQSFEQWRENER